MLAIQEELNQFKRNEVWTLVRPPQDHHIIGIEYIFKNKQDENEDNIKNKVRLIAQRYSYEEEIDYE